MDGDEFEPSGWDNDYSQPFASSAGSASGGVVSSSVVSEVFEEEEAPVAVLADTHSEPFEKKKSEAQLLVKIADPEKHGDGLDAYVTYAIYTQTSLTTYASAKCTVRRRYQDFLWLRTQLTKDNPAIILPPLPEKNRLEYLDRFSTEFLLRRQAALQRFLDRICSHPILFKSEILRTFLEAKAASFETAKQLKKGAIFEDLGDSVINAFSKLKRPNERFVAVMEYITKLEENLTSLESIHIRIVKRQSDLIADLAEVGSSFSLLSNSEDLTSEALAAVGSNTDKRVQLLKLTNDKVQLDFLERVRDYLLYCSSIKAVLRTRDARQMEYEDLTDLLTQQLSDRDKLMVNPSGAGGNVLTNTWNSVAGVPLTEQLKQERIEKANMRVRELEEAVKNSGEALKAFNLLVMQELDMFNHSKTDEFKYILRDYARIHADYYKQSAQEWEKVLPTIDAISTTKSV